MDNCLEKINPKLDQNLDFLRLYAQMGSIYFSLKESPMKSLIFCLIFLSLPTFAKHSQPTIKSQGSCTKSALADKVQVNGNIFAVNKKYALALKESQKVYNQVIKDLKELNKDLVVNSNLSIQEEYSWENNQQNLKGIRASYDLNISTNPAILNQVLNLLSEKSVKINGVNFLLSEGLKQKLIDQCMEGAATQAKSYAQKLAQSLGVELGSVQNASFNFNQPFLPRPMYMKTMAMSAEGAHDSQMGANELEVKIDTQVSFSIKPLE